MAFATCRGCGREFTKDGAGRQSKDSPRLCVDCEQRERGFHFRGHAPGIKCLDEYVGKA